MMFTGTYLKKRLYSMLILAIILFILSFSFMFLFVVGQILLIILFFICLLDWYLLQKYQYTLQCSRYMSERLSLGDVQKIHYSITNNSKRTLDLMVLDEFPYQLQVRDLSFEKVLEAGEEWKFAVDIRPVLRGEYNFGKVHVFVSSRYLALVQRRISFDLDSQIAVIPSIIQMTKYELEVFSKTASLLGVRRYRALGVDDEFEHIRPYQDGDQLRNINWKATSRTQSPMVNQFQDARAQMVYCIVDKGRSMRMPFHGLTLLDHAINASLVISNIVLKKYDKAGLITFSHQIDSVLSAKNIPNQLHYISQFLFNQQTSFKEPNYALLFQTIQRQIRRRSVLLFFTNFEHMHDLERNLEHFILISKRHLLLVIFFENSEVYHLANQPVSTVSDIYVQTFSKKAIQEKKLMLKKLRSHGVQGLLTKPEDLTLAVVNRYLQIKAQHLN